jgi:hypothetical protein
VAQEHTRNYTSTSCQQIIRVDTAQGVVYRGLTFLDTINDLLPTVFLSITCLFLLTQLVLNIKEDFRTLGQIIFFMSIVTMLLISTIKEYRNLDQLDEIKTRWNKSENKELATIIADRLKWTMLAQKQDYLIVRNPWRLLSGGENITILFSDNSIFFNSSSYPINGATRTTLTFGTNRRNLIKFKKYLGEIESGTTPNNVFASSRVDA